MNAPHTILAVDDDPEVLTTTVQLLRGAGYEVQEAATGQSCLESVRSHPTDLVLLDVNLPDINGVEVCQQIKSDPALAHHFVVLVSFSQISPGQQSFGLEAGANGYIARPIANREFLARVQSFLRMQQTEAALRKSEEELKAALREKQQLIGKLQAALQQVKLLSGFLPICASCKKIRDNKGDWIQVETYVTQHSQATFSHGLCPDCLKKYCAEVMKDEKK
jgi:DNA-binding response OmpR family regulator